MIGLRPAADARETVEERASEFFQRRRFWDWSAEDEAVLEAWLEESVLHRVAYLRVEASGGYVERLAALRPSGLEVLRPNRSYKRFIIPLLAAASIALIAAAGIPFVLSLMEPPVQAFATDVGGHALLKFGDRTEMELDTSTAVRYRMTNKERTVWLEHGTAYFRVAHNAANPFVVVAAGHRITDLGTEFLVRDDAQTLDVALVKGRAQLRSDNPGAGAATLSPRDEAIATPDFTTVTKKTQAELADELAWQRGMLVFHDTRLADAVREFNRYNRTKLVIADPTIADLKFGGGFRTDDVNNFLKLAQAVLKLRVDWQGNEILLSRDTREAAKKAVRAKHGE